MRLRTKWALAGGAWGLVAAWAAAVSVTGTIAGAFWLWVFGDDPWPAWSEPVLVAAGFGAAAVAFLAATAGGYLLGRNLERSGAPEAHRGAYLALAAALVTIVVSLAATWEARREARASREAEARAADHLRRLEPALDVELSRVRDGLRLRVLAADPARGRYEAEVALVSGLIGDAPIDAVTDTVTLGPGAARVLELTVPVDSVRRAFVERRVTETGVAWAVDLEVEARARLVPLPPRPVAGRLRSGVWNSLLVRFPGSSPGDTARILLPIGSRTREP